MKDTSSILEIEIDNARDSHLYMPVIGRPIRGRIDFLRVALHNPNAIQLTAPHLFPRGVPSQVIRIDLATRECSIIEPLREEKWAPEKAEIERRGLPVPEAVHNYTASNLADWLWPVQRAIRDGLAKVVKGELPKDLGVETPRAAAKDPSEERIDKLCNLIETLLDRIVPAGSR